MENMGAPHSEKCQEGRGVRTKGVGCAKLFWRNGLQLLNPETKESEGKERTRLPPSSPRSISHDSQTLENLIELSTRNIAVVVVEAIHTFPGFQSDMPVDYIGSRGEERRGEWREGKKNLAADELHPT